jgi:hypothetical protein
MNRFPFLDWRKQPKRRAAAPLTRQLLLWGELPPIANPLLVSGRNQMWRE